MFQTSEDRFQERIRRKTAKVIGDADRQEEARRASQLVADRVLKCCCLPTESSVLPRLPSVDWSVESSDFSVAFEYPEERAVRRGLRRGSREENEAGDDDVDDIDSEFDITTITEPATMNTDESKSSKKKKDRKKKGLAKWKFKNFVADDFEDHTSGDAWMCGVCGKAFSTLESAEKHEDAHLRQVIAGLGWTGENQRNWAFLHTPSEDLHGRQSLFHSVAVGRQRADSIDSIFRRARTQSGDFSVDHSSHRRCKPERQPQHFKFDQEDSNGEEGRQPAALPRELSQELPSYLPEGTLVPKPRARTFSEVRFDERASGNADLLMGRTGEPSNAVLMSESFQNYVVLADEALIDVCERAKPLILSEAELEAERELALLAKDKAYYDWIAERAVARRTNPSNRFRTDGGTIVGKAKNKFLDAYQLMKQGDATRGVTDQYTRKKTGDGESANTMDHSDHTLYLNVMVKNSVQVVRHELERLARQKWEERPEEVDKYTRFERFRVYAHVNIVKLAGIALASDFTPRRIAIQLSNDLYRLLTPRLKRRGVLIETEIEYRVGGYFVLAVNLTSIDWARLIKTNRQDLMARQAKWRRKHPEDDLDGQKHSFLKRRLKFWRQLLSLTTFDIIAQVLAWFYHLHWIIYLPMCTILYRSPLGLTIRKFILSSVTDEIFYYVEEKGMEMECVVCRAEKQAAFMLNALREIRAGDRELKKRREETKKSEVGVILGPLLGPAIKADKGPAVLPPGFELPPNLESVGLEVDLPVGFRRVRWALLSKKSTFMTEALFKTEAKYENITVGDWSHHNEYIGAPTLPADVKEEYFIGAQMEASYLMPKSAFVNANMCYETSEITAYNDYCFCIKKFAKTPDVPFGSTFICWTQVVVVNLGNDSCRLCCSVEAEFPNGPPMVARSIQSGMRAGTAESFVLLGETLTKYGDHYP